MIIEVADFRERIDDRPVQRHPKTSPSSYGSVSVMAASKKGGGGGSPKALDVEEEATGPSLARSWLAALNTLERPGKTGLLITVSSTAWLSTSLSLTGVVCGTGGRGMSSSIVPSLVTSGDILMPKLAVLSFLTLRASGLGENAWLEAIEVNA